MLLWKLLFFFFYFLMLHYVPAVTTVCWNCQIEWVFNWEDRPCRRAV